MDKDEKSMETECIIVLPANMDPGASLSLQKHHHRSEHWIVVKGTAKITNGEKVILLTENQSPHIPLGENDIVRFKDNYGRKT